MITRIAAILFAVAAIAASVPAIQHLREEPPPPPPAVRLALPVPVGVEPGVGDEPFDAAISPDESEVVFVGTRVDGGPDQQGATQLWRLRLNGGDPEPLPGTTGAQYPAWKQTGRVIAFFADGTLQQLTLADGAVSVLAEAPSPAGAAWLQDGSLIFAAGAGPLRRMRAGVVEEATALESGDRAHTFPVAVAGSNAFTYTAAREDGRRIARLVEDGRARELAATAGHAALVSGRVLLARDGVLLAYDYNRETGALSPRGVTLATGVGVSASGRTAMAASPGLLIYAPAAERLRRAAWLDFSGRPLGFVTDAGDYWQVRLSPDDRYAAMTARDPLLRAFDIVTVPTDGSGIARQLTLALAADTDPVWSPDGSRVLFRSAQGGRVSLYTKLFGVADAGDEPLVEAGAADSSVPSQSATPSDWNGRQVLVHARGAAGFDILILDTRTGAAGPLASTPFNESDARWSRDGDWIAYVSDESGRADIYVRPPDRTRLRVSFAGGTRPRWSRDGRTLLFVRGSQVMRADRIAGTTQFATPQVAFDAPGLRDFDVAHTQDRLLALVAVAGEGRAAPSVVMHWRSAP